MCLVLGVFPLKDTLFNVFCWFVNIGVMASSRKLVPKWSVSDPGVSAQPYDSLFALGNTRQHLGFMLGGHFKCSHQQKAQKVKSTALSILRKSTVYRRRLKPGKAWSFSVSAGNMCVRPLRFLIPWLMSANVCESAVSIYLGITNKF